MILKFSNMAFKVGTPHIGEEQGNLVPLWTTIDKVDKVRRQNITFETDNDGYEAVKKTLSPELIIMNYTEKENEVFYRILEYEREGHGYYVMYNGPAYLCNDAGQTIDGL